MSFYMKAVLSCAMVFAFAPCAANAVLITGTRTWNINEDGVEHPWFTGNGTSPYRGSIAAGTGTVTTVTNVSQHTITGNSTPESGFTDGIGIPAGVVIGYDVSFTITSTGGGLLTSVNNGIEVNSSNIGSDPNTNQLNPGEQLHFSQITFSNVSILADPNNYLLDNSVTIANAAWRVLRQNSFVGTADGVTTSSDAAATTDVKGFGLSGPGVIGNNFNDGLFGPLASVYITTDVGAWRLKGIGFQADITVNAIPEPSALLLALSALMTVLVGRRQAF